MIYPIPEKYSPLASALTILASIILTWFILILLVFTGINLLSGCDHWGDDRCITPHMILEDLHLVN